MEDLRHITTNVSEGGELRACVDAELRFFGLSPLRELERLNKDQGNCDNEMAVRFKFCLDHATTRWPSAKDASGFHRHLTRVFELTGTQLERYGTLTYVTYNKKPLPGLADCCLRDLSSFSRCKGGEFHRKVTRSSPESVDDDGVMILEKLVRLHVKSTTFTEHVIDVAFEVVKYGAKVVDLYKDMPASAEKGYTIFGSGSGFEHTWKIVKELDIPEVIHAILESKYPDKWKYTRLI